jgi:hypothetical protein
MAVRRAPTKHPQETSLPVQIGGQQGVVEMHSKAIEAGSLWFTLELPKIRAIRRPIYQEMRLLPAPGIDLISDVQEPAI